MKKRWDRQSEISPADDMKLDRVCESTPGLSRYGNKARASVMLPLELAELVAQRARLQGKTVNQIIIDMLKSMEEK